MSRKNHDPRHVARALALQNLFANLATGQTYVDLSDLLQELDVEVYDQQLYQKIVDGVISSQQNIDPVIQKLAPAWPLEQIAPVDITLLRMGIWEAFISELTPHKVVINEMIELAKEFGGENTGPFVNGVLASLLNDQHKSLVTQLKK